MDGVLQTDVAVQRVEIDGVPVFWSDSPEPRRVSLVFRTGRADETLASAGLTHLAEHLALFAAGADARHNGGFVDHLRTVFFATGSDGELCDFVARLLAALSSLPLERAEEEKRVLLTEAASTARGSWKRLMGLRFGAQSFGLVDFEELGLRRPGTSELAEWCRRRFVLGNLAVWMTGPPPADLRFPLPDGGRSDLPSLQPLPALELPAYVTSGGGGVVASFVGRRSVALTVALSLLQQRLHEGLRVRRALSYSVGGNYLPLSAEWAHVTLGADCLDEHAADVRDELVAELERLSADGPEPHELSDLTDAIMAAWAEEQALVLSDLDAAATNELLGAPQTPRDLLREEYSELTPAAVRDVLGESLATTMLVAPTGSRLPDNFSRYRSGPAVRLEGRRYLRRGRRIYDLPRRSKIIASEQGITVLRDASSREPVTVRFADTAAVLELGPGRFSLIGVNGDWVEVDTNVLLRGQKLEEELRQRVPCELLVPFEASRGSVLDLSREKIGYRTLVAKEIGLLPSRLEPGEKVLTLGVAMLRRRRGLFALTDRRLIHLSKAGTAKPRMVEIDLAEVEDVRPGSFGRLGRTIAVRTASGKKTRFSNVSPPERVDEFREALSTPRQPQFTPRPLTTSTRGLLLEYGAGLAFLVLAVLLFLATFRWSAALFWLLVSSLLFIRTYLRRRERKRHGGGSR